ncbi:MAG: hypothetical protein HYV09_07315 [Deltaproteobacteria bacterium]|nr:hypothetical protein [Deltaproteobacteria bacterium]
MALIAAPDRPLRDVHLKGVLLSLVRLIGVLRVTAGVVLVATYLQTWQIQAGVPRSGLQLAAGSPLPVVFAGTVAGLGWWLMRAPSLARGMLSAAGSVVCALAVFFFTRNQSAAPVGDAVLRPAQVVFGFTFILLTFFGFADLVFQPILYMWQRRADEM